MSHLAEEALKASFPGAPKLTTKTSPKATAVKSLPLVDDPYTVALDAEIFEQISREAKRRKEGVGRLVGKLLRAAWRTKEEVPVEEKDEKEVRLEDDVMERLRREAKKSKKTLASVVSASLRAFFDDQAKPERPERPGEPGSYIVNVDLILDGANPSDAEAKAEGIAKDLEKRKSIHGHLVLFADAA